MCPVGANLVLASEQSPGPAQITGCLASVVSEDLRTQISHGPGSGEETGSEA